MWWTGLEGVRWTSRLLARPSPSCPLAWWIWRRTSRLATEAPSGHECWWTKGSLNRRHYSAEGMTEQSIRMHEAYSMSLLVISMISKPICDGHANAHVDTGYLVARTGP